MTGRNSLSTGRIIGLAVLAGAVVGGLALYGTSGQIGNTGLSRDAVSAADDSCPAKAALARQIGDAAVGDIAAMLPADPPQSLKTLGFDGPDGQPMTLDALAGKTLLVNLWATWCAPCRAEMPALDALEREMGGEAFEVVAINVDTGGAEKPKAFLDEVGVSALGNYRDATMGVFHDLKRRALALGLPITLLVDGEGCLLAHMNGPAEWSGDDARAWIGGIIGGEN